MDFGLQCALHAQRDAAEAMIQHFASRKDDKALELFDEFLDAQRMLLALMNDGKREQYARTK